jgi:putative phosphoesterase
VSEAPGSHAFSIGIISDTHGVLTDAALRALAGSDAIVHAGDVVGPGVLGALRSIAPVVAVRGNCDTAGEEQELPRVANVVLGGVRVMVAHKRAQLSGSCDPVAAGARIAVFGHTHVASVEERDGVLFVNPGSASAPAGSAPSVARIAVEPDGAVSAEIVPLKVG